jgi:ABC-type sugar transport system permease subunit
LIGSPTVPSNFSDVFDRAPLVRYAVNSFLYAGLATLGVLISSVPVAYALSRLRWRGRNLAFILVLATMMLPPQVTIVPLYVMFSKLHLVGSIWPLIIPNWFGDAFSIFLLRQFFLTIPAEYSDAARVDGAASYRVMLNVVVRLAKRRGGGRPVQLPLLLERLLRPCSTPVRTPTTGRCRRPRPVPQRPPGPVEPDDGGDAPLHAAGDPPVLRRSEGLHRGRDPDGVKG